MKTNETKATFKAGQMYYGRHICSSDAISRYLVSRILPACAPAAWMFSTVRGQA